MAVWLPPVNIPSFSGGPDYSANLYNGLSGIGDAVVANRAAKVQQGQFAQGLALDQQRLSQAQTIADRNYALDLKKYDLAATKLNMPGKATTDQQNYEYAVKNGYTGDFASYVRNKQPVNIGNIPPDYTLDTTNPSGVQLKVIPNSKTDLENKAAEQVKLNKLTNQAQQAETMLYSTSHIKEEMANANTPATGTLSRPFAWYSGSPAGRVRSFVAGLKSGIVFEGMIKLKNASSTGATGFGQMNLSELQTLIDQVGSLNPDNTEPDIFLATIDRIERQWNAVVNDIRANVSPEDLAKLGLENVFGPNAGVAPAGQQDESGNTWEPVN